MSKAGESAQGPLYWLVVAGVAFGVMLLTSGWWSGAEMWKIAVSGGLSGLTGSVTARWVMARLAGRKS